MSDAERELREIIKAQAEDEALWIDARYVTEDYLQRELRKLHAAVEAYLEEEKK